MLQCCVVYFVAVQESAVSQCPVSCCKAAIAANQDDWALFIMALSLERIIADFIRFIFQITCRYNKTGHRKKFILHLSLFKFI